MVILLWGCRVKKVTNAQGAKITVDNSKSRKPISINSTAFCSGVEYTYNVVPIDP